MWMYINTYDLFNINFINWAEWPCHESDQYMSTPIIDTDYFFLHIAMKSRQISLMLLAWSAIVSLTPSTWVVTVLPKNDTYHEQWILHDSLTLKTSTWDVFKPGPTAGVRLVS